MRLARRLGIDHAVGFAVLARIWQLLTGQITVLLIVFFFSDRQQGYYYAFTSLLAMQVFVELGLHVVLINVASHEWAGLSLVDGRIRGASDQISRLVSLGRTAVRWYSGAMVLFVGVVAVAGFWFFRDVAGQPVENDLILVMDNEHVVWTAPWISLVLLTGLQLMLLPLTAILEGCGQLATINRVRFLNGMIGSVVVWSLMIGGLGLWALTGAAAVRLVGEFYLVTMRFRGFFAPFLKPPALQRINWRREVLPLQWRMAAQGAIQWLGSHLAVLVVITYRGEAAGGHFGMMWTILTVIQGSAVAWIETRRPLFGRLIAERDFAELDRQFFWLSRISILMMLLGGMSFVAGLWIVNEYSNWLFDALAARLPSVTAAAVLVAGFVLMQFAQCTNIYVRAHKRDPFLFASIVSNLTIAGLVFWLGKHHGILGAATGYLIGVGMVQSPLWVTIWWFTRKRWHH